MVYLSICGESRLGSGETTGKDQEHLCIFISGEDLQEMIRHHDFMK